MARMPSTSRLLSKIYYLYGFTEAVQKVTIDLWTP